MNDSPSSDGTDADPETDGGGTDIETAAGGGGADPDGFAAKQAAAADADDPEPYDPREDLPAYGEDDDQDYVDRSAIDFDPNEGLYSGTAVDGSTKIPGEHPDLEERGIEYHPDEFPDEGDGSADSGDSGDSGEVHDRPKPGPGRPD